MDEKYELTQSEILVVNAGQRQFYEDFECTSAGELLKNYLGLINFERLEHEVSILDVGGASGFFAKTLLNCLKEKGFSVRIYVVDTSEYSTWSDQELWGEVEFIKGSVENIDEIFGDLQFDLIFCNRVVHHLVTGKSYRSTICVIENCIQKISTCLKTTGQLCVLDHYYDGFLIDSFPSRMIYKCTSCKNAFLANMFKKLGAQSAGCGVCFLSEEMWHTLMEKYGLKQTAFQGGRVADVSKMRRIAFLLRKMSQDNYMIFSKSEMMPRAVRKFDLQTSVE